MFDDACEEKLAKILDACVEDTRKRSNKEEKNMRNLDKSNDLAQCECQLKPSRREPK
jgi:hypothetical protein